MNYHNKELYGGEQNRPTQPGVFYGQDYTSVPEPEQQSARQPESSEGAAGFGHQLYRSAYEPPYRQPYREQPEQNASVLHGHPLYQAPPEPGPAFSPDPTPQRQPEKKPPKKRRAGFVASLVAVALVGGAAGGGAAAFYFTSQPAAQPETSEASTPSPAPTPEVIPTTNLVVTEGDVTAAVDKAAASVVEIGLKNVVNSFFGQQEVESAGSGVIFTEDGYIITNDHVVESGGQITVRTMDGTEYEAELIGTDPKTDLAVLKIDATGLIPATFGDSDSVQVGQVAVAIGNPLGTLGGTVTNGIVSAKDREITIGDQTMTLMQTSAAINPGNSGGGLFNAAGELIGIVNAKSSGMDVEGLGFAIPANTAAQVAADLIEYGYVTGRPELGIQVIEVNDPRAAAYYGVNGYGIFIMETTRENGLQPGDRIIAINGEEVTSASSISEAVLTHKVGESMEIVVERDGAQITLEVPVGEQVPESVKASLPMPGDV